jgi:hypothetical protein
MASTVWVVFHDIGDEFWLEEIYDNQQAAIDTMKRAEEVTGLNPYRVEELTVLSSLSQRTAEW